MKSGWLMTLTLALLVAGSVTAQAGARCAVLDQGLAMVATSQGAGYSAAGAVKAIVDESCREAFGLMVSVDLPEGTRLTVSATTAQGAVDIGTVTLEGGRGEIYLDRSKVLTKLFPIADVRWIEVRYPQGAGTGAGHVLLQTAF